MKINFDSEADAVRIKFQPEDSEYKISKEVDEGIIIDLDKDNKIMAIEILDVSEKIPEKDLRDINLGVSE
jgi:uncharacterized protein YuzE